LDPRRLRLAYDPPVDRQCRICNRIGHIAKTCTFAPKNDDGSLLYVQDDEAEERGLGLFNKFGSEASESPPHSSRKTFHITTRTETFTLSTPTTSTRSLEPLQSAPIPITRPQGERAFERPADDLFSDAGQATQNWMNPTETNSGSAAEVDQDRLRKLQEGISATLALMNLGGTSDMPSTSNGKIKITISVES